MSKFLNSTLLATLILNGALSLSVVAADKKPNYVEKPQEVEVDNKESMDFIFKEVIPAFGGWDAILAEFPEVELSLNMKGMKLNSCSISVNLSQLRPISLELVNVPGYDFSSDAAVGDDLEMHGNVYCGDQNSTDTIHVVVDFGFTGPEDRQPHALGYRAFFEQMNNSAFTDSKKFIKENVAYPLQINAMGTKQMLNLKLYYLTGDAKIISTPIDIVIGEDGEVRPASEISEEAIEQGQISLKDWADINSDEMIDIRKAHVVSRIEVDFKLKLSLPVTDLEGKRQTVPGTGALKGTIYTTEDGESINILSVPVKKD